MLEIVHQLRILHLDREMREIADRAADEIERLRVDAERYRWVRDDGLNIRICRYDDDEQYDGEWSGWYEITRSKVDAAVDAAMKEQKE